MKRKTVTIAAVSAVALLSFAGIRVLEARQAPSVKRNILMKQDMTIPGREAIMALVELPPGSAEGRHTHTAELYGYVLEGTVSLDVEGKPAATLKAGDTFSIAPGQIHEASNKGSATAKLVAVFVAEKGKPLTTQAQ
jgi:quercetin dioxygenase-like cupin family protein